MSIYGLADCNNFFVSCERIFRPALEGRPAVVLSSNDGGIVTRSDEAKALGAKMAQPAFQAKDLLERHSIAVISGNLQFYTDMSNRVMQVFGELVPAVEKSSIDECFLDLAGIPQDLAAFCQDLKRTVRQWTGLPISIGIAETKTLAKIANRLAKTSAKTDGVLDLTGERWRDRALASTEVGDIWGIGRQYAKKLNRNGVMTALDLADLGPPAGREHAGAQVHVGRRHSAHRACARFRAGPRRTRRLRPRRRARDDRRRSLRGGHGARQRARALQRLAARAPAPDWLQPGRDRGPGGYRHGCAEAHGLRHRDCLMADARVCAECRRRGASPGTLAARRVTIPRCPPHPYRQPSSGRISIPTHISPARRLILPTNNLAPPPAAIHIAGRAEAARRRVP